MVEKIAEIPFWVYDRPKWISGITSSTSCDDILRSLASFLPETENHRFAENQANFRGNTETSLI